MPRRYTYCGRYTYGAHCIPSYQDEDSEDDYNDKDNCLRGQDNSAEFEPVAAR
jgi:hypothetical protein